MVPCLSGGYAMCVVEFSHDKAKWDYFYKISNILTIRWSLNYMVCNKFSSHNAHFSHFRLLWDYNQRNMMRWRREKVSVFSCSSSILSTRILTSSVTSEMSPTRNDHKDLPKKLKSVDIITQIEKLFLTAKNWVEDEEDKKKSWKSGKVNSTAT